MENNLITVKYKGFKSYQETSIIGPFKGLLGITGKNGSGKTNFTEGLEILFDTKIKNTYSNHRNQLFPKKVPHKEKNDGITQTQTI